MTVGHMAAVELEGEAPRQFAASPATPLADLLAGQGLPLNTRCGGRGICHGCELELRHGTLKVAGQTLSAPATVRACQAHLAADVTLHIPARSRMEHRPQVIDTFRIDVPCAHQPLFEDDQAGRDTAFAVDLGTTTVAVLLVDLRTGEILSRAGGFNQQIRFGDNVLTRIDAARAPAALSTLQSAAVSETIAPLLLRACGRAARAPSRLAGGVIAGNTTMLHLLAGIDPTPLGTAPFTPRFIAGKRLAAFDIGLAFGENGSVLHPATPLQLLPGIAAYIGADIAAGIYATGMIFDQEPSLLLDIGTNGEIVLQHEGRLIACATAAGPAFEGCGLRCGSRAREGAVSAIDIATNPFRLDAETIGGLPVARAPGICGTAYLDFLSAARRCELLNTAGRFDSAAWASLPPAWRAEYESSRALSIGGPALISEADIAILLQAKAAIGAGIETLLEAAGISQGDISRVYLAGGFGMRLRVANAIAIGLLPHFRVDQVRVVGNTSLAGALLALLDRTTLDELEALRSRVEILELNLVDDFEDRYVSNLFLP